MDFILNITRLVASCLVKTVVSILNLVYFKKEIKTIRILKKKPELYINKLFHNPLVVAQVKEELVFEPDYFLGHKSPPEKDFFGEMDFVSFQTVVDESQKTGKEIVLNLGDSSTSGWDSNVVEDNRMAKERSLENIKLPFFKYKTYSDFLRRRIDDYIIVNAGIPAYTSVQGARYLSVLLDAFHAKNCKIRSVTVYFGNNDCSWNANREDKFVIPGNPVSFLQKVYASWFNNSMYAKLSLADKMRRNSAPIHTESVITRTGIDDFSRNIEAMITICKDRGIDICLIEPVIPLLWEPGKRAKNIDFPSPFDKDSPGGFHVYKLLEEANSFWKRGINLLKDRSRYDDMITNFTNAMENDFLVPRIKKAYKLTLEKVAIRHNVPLIKIVIPRNESEIEYVLDYCHPNEPANEMIADKLEEFIKSLPQSNKHKKINDSAIRQLSKLLNETEKPKYVNGIPPVDSYPMV
jgi:lysophospholipase L1-like esterase